MPRRRFTSGRKFSTTTSAFFTMRLKAATASGAFKLSVMLRLLRCRFWKSDPSRGPPSGSPPPGSGGNSILITLAPQSASWRTQVGPERTRVRSSTVKRSSAREALGNGISSTLCAVSCRPARRRQAPTLPRSPAYCLPRTRFEWTAGFRLWWRDSGGRPNLFRTPRMSLPTMTRLSRLLLALAIASAATFATAQERPRRAQAAQQQQAQEQQRPAESVLRLLPADSVTEHSINIPAGKLTYTATAG